MKYDFDTPIDRLASESFKWRVFDEDVLPLWVADMDFLSPEPVIRALEERVSHGIFGYPLEMPELRELIVARMAEHYQWEIASEAIVFLPGVVVGFNLACHAVNQPKGNVLVQTPVYPPILSAARCAGMASRENLLVQGADGFFEVDLDDFAAVIEPNTRLFILCNPHNPVGRVFRSDELIRMAEICLQNQVTICSDEIHNDLIFQGHKHIPIAALSPEIAEQTITLMAPSKTFNIAGLECAYAIIPNESLRRRYQHATQGLVNPFINILGWVAATAAYQDGQEWLTQVLAYLESNRDFVCSFVQQELPNIKTIAPEGTYLAWLDCRAAGMGDKPGQFFLEKAHVALNEGDTFGMGGEGFVRLNFGCSKVTLIDALERMKKAIHSSLYSSNNSL